MPSFSKKKEFISQNQFDWAKQILTFKGVYENISWFYLLNHVYDDLAILVRIMNVNQICAEVFTHIPSQAHTAISQHLNV